MVFSELLSQVISKKIAIEKAAQFLNFRNLSILNEGNGRLNLLVKELTKEGDDNKAILASRTRRQLYFQVILEKLLGCKVKIHIEEMISKIFLDDYVAESISIDKQEQEIEQFFRDSLNIDMNESDIVDEEDDVFLDHYEDYSEKAREDFATHEGWSPLLASVYFGDLGKIKAEINPHFLEEKDNNGKNAIEIAEECGQKEILDYLLDYQRNIGKNVSNDNLSSNDSLIPDKVGVVEERSVVEQDAKQEPVNENEKTRAIEPEKKIIDLEKAQKEQETQVDKQANIPLSPSGLLSTINMWAATPAEDSPQKSKQPLPFGHGCRLLWF